MHSHRVSPKIAKGKRLSWNVSSERFPHLIFNQITIPGLEVVLVRCRHLLRAGMHLDAAHAAVEGHIRVIHMSGDHQAVYAAWNKGKEQGEKLNSVH